ncbi:MAG: oxepin-CoA hydrolase, alternative type [Leptothrix sp. (in: b-proteobacteria)]
MSAQLLTERHGTTLVLTLSDPATRNALSPELYAAGFEALASAESNPEIRAVVLTGAAGHFCGGGNLGQLALVRGQPEQQAARVDALHAWVEAIRSHPKPVIAAVEGAAAGAGCSLALACDLLVASSAARFGLAYGKLGFTSDGGATHHLAHGLPRAQALEWLWLAQTRSTAELDRLGLVNRVTEPGAALAEALLLAEQLGRMAPNALASAKQLLNQAATSTLAEHLPRERDAFVANVNHANGGEGLAAWRDKREPRFE